jgi:hypothetical protein
MYSLSLGFFTTHEPLPTLKAVCMTAVPLHVGLEYTSMVVTLAVSKLHVTLLYEAAVGWQDVDVTISHGGGLLVVTFGSGYSTVHALS